eukprot:CAMPEP_0196592332 /NCGR_PEP_ID=MMETSP1081-20130531/72452_1 /TAXON_ID=36882 /ORGANISM="Pyramimonas amylifera, Strain CCMP720" /LENGTH=76 /DNA_ID=CAMNT_0041915985 /DNA_START=1033 /DNA_END=1260 /DNA_ORIENTATION=+
MNIPESTGHQCNAVKALEWPGWCEAVARGNLKIGGRDRDLDVEEEEDKSGRRSKAARDPSKPPANRNLPSTPSTLK